MLRTRFCEAGGLLVLILRRFCIILNLNGNEYSLQTFLAVLFRFCNILLRCSSGHSGAIVFMFLRNRLITI